MNLAKRIFCRAGAYNKYMTKRNKVRLVEGIVKKR